MERNIYKIGKELFITSDEEIKEGDWWLNLKTNDADKCTHKSEVLLYNSEKYEHIKKIILTTDQDLIKDGVQSIPDDFLEWFVKNPSCEEVEIKPLLSNNGRALFGYKIIIPKEDPKQETLKEFARRIYDLGIYSTEEACIEGAKWQQEQHKIDTDNAYSEGFENGKNWQAERSYSEEEVQVKLYECLGYFAQKHNIIINGNEIDQWFEQFKKK